MSSIDNRIVSMKFDNAQFERGVSTTISSMDRLKASLNFKDAHKNLDGLASAGKSFTMGNMEGAVTGVSKAFIALSTIGITTLSNLTNKAISTGTQLIKSLTIDPISSGLKEYETNLSSIQTIMSNTASEGTKLEDVNKALDELNKYSDQTIYNFSEMARNIGTFTAAGVKLEPAVSAIKGISNLAAVSGSNAEQASTAMYQLSQALSTGKVSLMDWNSVVNAGMGGKVFQEALKRTARSHGVAVDSIIKKEGSFRDSLSKGWLDSKILTETLAQFTGDLSDEQLRSQGYTKEQIKDIQELAETAKNAATKVKTMSQLIDTLKETAGSGWADTWELIFGDFDEAKELFTSLNDVIGGWIKTSAEARNKILGDWKKLGGRTHLIEALKNIFEALGRVLGPIGQAFREIFPRTTGQQLYDMTLAFENFTKRLKISDATMENLKSTFKGIFAIFSIFRQLAHGVIKIVLSVFDALAGPGAGAGGGFLAITAKIGDFLSGIDAMLKKTQIIKKVFDTIGGSIAFVIKLIWDLGKAIVGVFTGNQSNLMSGISDQFENLTPIIDGVKEKIQSITDTVQGFISNIRIPSDLFGVTTAADNASESLDNLDASVHNVGFSFDGIKESAKNFADAIGDIFGWIGDQIGKVTEGMNMEDWLALINTGFFIALVKTIRDVVKPIGKIMENYAGLIENAGNAFTNLGGALKGMQQNLKADALLKIALALLVLVAAIWLLSFLEPAEVAQGVAALAAMLLVLNVSLKALSKGLSSRSVARLYALSGAMIILALALTAMSGAVLAFGSMDIETLKKGFGSIVAIMVIMAAMMLALNKAGGAKQIAITGAGLFIMAGALTALAGVILLFERIDTDTMVSGLLKLAAVLVVLAIFMKMVSGAQVGSLIGLIAAAFAIGMLAESIEQMGKVPFGTMAKGLAIMAGALTILAIALYAMTSSLPGAAALLVAVFALKLLVPVLLALGQAHWQDVARGLGFLAAAFAVVAIGGLLLAPVVPVLVLFGYAVLLVGAAMLVAGVGMLAFATGLGILAVVGAAGFAVLTAAIITFVELLPLIAEQFALGLVAWAKVIGEKAPIIIEALGKLFSALLAEARKRAPEFYRTMIDLLIQMIRAIIDKLPEFVDAAIDLLEAFVDTFGSRENIARIYTAAAELIINFLNGLADAIDSKSSELGAAGGRIAASIVTGMIKGIGSAAGAVWKKIRGIVSGGEEAAMDELDSDSPSKVFMRVGRTIPEGLAQGIDKYSKVSDRAAENMADSTVASMQNTIARLSEAMDADLDTTPVIAPVLDLTEFRKTASQLAPILESNPLAAQITFAQAASIAAIKRPIEDETDPRYAKPEIKFEQNNYSPKSLSEAEIYRNTRNQLTYARELMVG